MPDLKDLLRPLDDETMPDRWDRIGRRPIEPLGDPRRPRRAFALGTAAVAALLVVAVIAALGPLRGNPATVGEPGTDQPPTWLVDAAYRAAYENGDLIPDAAQWALLPRSAIPTPVGPAGAGSSEPEYVIVLKGRFTAYGASSPLGASLPTGSYLSVAYKADTHQVTDFGLDNQPVNIAALQPFELPSTEQMYASTRGWSVALPPGWKAVPLVEGWSDVAGPGAVISNHDPEVPVARDGYFPQASSDGFPSNGITLVVAKMNGVIPGPFNPKEPPVSYDDFAEGSALGGASTLDSIVFGGPDGEYTATVRTGPDASALDLAAIRDVVATFAFASGPSTSPEPSIAPNPDDWPPLKAVQLVSQQVVRSTKDVLVVQAPVGKVQWTMSACDVSGRPVGGPGAGGFGGECGGAPLTASAGGLTVDHVFYNVLSGNAFFGSDVTIKVSFVGGTKTMVQSQDGRWMIVFIADTANGLYAPTSHVATVTAVSGTGHVLGTVQVP